MVCRSWCSVGTGENPDIYTKKEFLMMELYLLMQNGAYRTQLLSTSPSTFRVWTMWRKRKRRSRVAPHRPIPSSEQSRSERRAQVDRLTSCFLDASLRGIYWYTLEDSQFVCHSMP